MIKCKKCRKRHISSRFDKIHLFPAAGIRFQAFDRIQAKQKHTSQNFCNNPAEKIFLISGLIINKKQQQHSADAHQQLK